MSGGCEWNPEKGRAATSYCRHYIETRSEVIVGADGEWRLCLSCASLPAFRRYRVRRPIAARENISGIGGGDGQGI